VRRVLVSVRAWWFGPSSRTAPSCATRPGLDSGGWGRGCHLLGLESAQLPHDLCEVMRGTHSSPYRLARGANLPSAHNSTVRSAEQQARPLNTGFSTSRRDSSWYC